MAAKYAPFEQYLRELPDFTPGVLLLEGPRKGRWICLPRVAEMNIPQPVDAAGRFPV
jgi:hypothetical protein